MLQEPPHCQARRTVSRAIGAGLIVLLSLPPAARSTARPVDTSQRGLLKVSANGRFLVRQDGTPFFYLGDTAWELFHRLKREEAGKYLENRARKGFTVIQAVVVAEQGGLKTSSAYGHTPFHDRDSRRPNEGYFAHVDSIVNKTASLGLYLGMLPSWGRWVGDADAGRPDGDFFNAHNAADHRRR